MRKSIKTLIICIIVCIGHMAVAQDELMSIIESEEKATEKVEATFKGTRIISTHSVETRGLGTFDVIFMHRFGTLNSGAYNLWGLDDAWIRLGAEYAISDDFTLGAGRSSYEKTYDGFLKYCFLHQQDGVKKFPFTSTAFASMAINTLKSTNPEQEIKFSSRVSYTWQLLVARKINTGLSVQVSPTLVHHNLVNTAMENNDILAIGLGARQKIAKRMALTLEYYYQFNNNTLDENHNPLGLGLEIETGGHVFQLVFANSQAMIEKAYITETSGDFFDGDIHFGFNITRAFQVKKQQVPNSW